LGLVLEQELVFAQCAQLVWEQELALFDAQAQELLLALAQALAPALELFVALALEQGNLGSLALEQAQEFAESA